MIVSIGEGFIVYSYVITKTNTTRLSIHAGKLVKKKCCHPRQKGEQAVCT
jgi:hypothetical protein